MGNKKFEARVATVNNFLKVGYLSPKEKRPYYKNEDQ